MSDLIIDSEDINVELNRNVSLSDNEKKAVNEFLHIKKWSKNDAHKWNLCVKFLMARKFDVKRALDLYNAHDELRTREKLFAININNKQFQNELKSNKFTILPCVVHNRPVCALYTVKHHETNTHEANLSTLQALVYQLDAALENVDAQRNGIIFIYDMNACKKENVDLFLSNKILSLIRGSYPARLNKLIILEAPFWFRFMARLLSVLIREKLRDRVVFASNFDLHTHLPLELLPKYMGGLVEHDHNKWLEECYQLVNNKASTCYYYYNNNNNCNNNNQQLNNTNGSKKRPASDFLIDETYYDTTAPNIKRVDVFYG